MDDWIPVKERLPENYQPVFVLLGLRGKVAVSSIQQQIITTADQKMITIKTWEKVINCQVTHWMLCPRNPNGKGIEVLRD